MVGQELTYERLNFPIEGGREQHPLSICRCVGQHCADLGKESHVGHLVCFVQRGDLDRIEHASSLAQMVCQSAGRCDENVDAAAKLLDLLVERSATDRCANGQTLSACVGGQGFYDLEREFTSRYENERARSLGCRAVSVQSQASEDRQAEGQSLAGPRLSATEDVLACDGVGKCLRLDGRRNGDGISSQCGDDRFW